MSATGPADPRVQPSRRLQIAGLAISAVCFGGVVLWALHQPAPELPSGDRELVALVAAIGLLLVTTVLRAERWRLLVRQAGGGMAGRDAIGLTVVGFMGNSVLPARGGDVLRVVLGRPRSGVGARALIGTLLAERILDVITLLGMFAVIAGVVLRGTDTPATGALAGVAAAGLAVTIATGATYLLRGRFAWASRAVDLVAPMTVSTRELVGGHGLAMAALTLALWLCEATIWLAASFAVGLDLSPLEALYVMSASAVFVLIPSGPGYAGTLDAGVIFGARALGFGGQAVLSYLLVLRFVLTVPLTVAGIVLLLTRYGGRGAMQMPRQLDAA